MDLFNLKRSEESKNSQTWKWCRSLSCVVFPISSLKSAECTAFSIVWENIIRKTQKLGLISDLYFWQAVLLKTQCYQAQSATQTEDGKAPLLIPWNKNLRNVASSDVGISARTAIAESTSCQGDLRTCTQPAPLKNKIFKSRSPGSAIFYICHKVFRQKTQLLFHLRKENALIKSFVKKAGTSFCLLLHRSYDCAILNTDIYSIDRGLTDLSKRQGPICHEKKLTSILKLVYQKADTY